MSFLAVFDGNRKDTKKKRSEKRLHGQGDERHSGDNDSRNDRIAYRTKSDVGPEADRVAEQADPDQEKEDRQPDQPLGGREPFEHQGVAAARKKSGAAAIRPKPGTTQK